MVKPTDIQLEVMECKSGVFLIDIKVDEAHSDVFRSLSVFQLRPFPPFFYEERGGGGVGFLQRRFVMPSS